MAKIILEKEPSLENENLCPFSSMSNKTCILGSWADDNTEDYEGNELLKCICIQDYGTFDFSKCPFCTSLDSYFKK